MGRSILDDFSVAWAPVQSKFRSTSAAESKDGVVGDGRPGAVPGELGVERCSVARAPEANIA